MRAAIGLALGFVIVLSALAVEAQSPSDHYKCYRARQHGPRTQPRVVILADQFEEVNTTVVAPRRFCNPVNKNAEGVTDPTAHLMCYTIRGPRFERRHVIIKNQFGEQTLTVRRPETLCLPAEKDAAASTLNINHFKCYRVTRARRTPPFHERQVDLQDQFETRATAVLRPRLLCTPVDKNGEGIVDPEGHLTCYKIRDMPGQPGFERRQVDITDQFTEQDLTAIRGDCRESSFLCVPSTKREVGVPTTTTTTTTTTTSTTSTTTSTTTTTSTSSSTTIATTTTTSTTTTTLFGCPACDEYCSLWFALCAGLFPEVYTDADDCQNQCGAFPEDCDENDCVNSVQCRIIHLRLFQEDEEATEECEYASPSSEGPLGTVCADNPTAFFCTGS